MGFAEPWDHIAPNIERHDEIQHFGENFSLRSMSVSRGDYAVSYCIARLADPSVNRPTGMVGEYLATSYSPHEPDPAGSPCKFAKAMCAHDNYTHELTHALLRAWVAADQDDEIIWTELVYRLAAIDA